MSTVLLTLPSGCGELSVSLKISLRTVFAPWGRRVSSLTCLYSPIEVFSVAPPSPREVLVPSRGMFTPLPSPKCSPVSWGCLTLLTSRVHHPSPPSYSMVVWLQVELSDGTAHTITDAYAGKEYIIQVAAKDNEIGTWSDWSVAAHATPWTEEPRHLTTEAQAPGEPPLTPCCLLSSWDLERVPQGSLNPVWLPHSPWSVQPLLFLVLAVWTFSAGATGWRGHLCAWGKQQGPA